MNKAPEDFAWQNLPARFLSANSFSDLRMEANF